MKYKNIEYNGKQLIRINSKKVNYIIKHYKEYLNTIIYCLPINANPDAIYMNFFEIEITEYNDYYDYINIINEIIYYNCNNELGNYLKFYIEKVD